jgi:glycosyltransferase involved in cell wall biosynthesis
MACGVPVIASDLPSLREVGGSAAAYCPVAETRLWSATAIELLYEKQESPERWALRRTECLNQAGRFSWRESTRKVVAVYKELL